MTEKELQEIDVRIAELEAQSDEYERQIKELEEKKSQVDEKISDLETQASTYRVLNSINDVTEEKLVSNNFKIRSSYYKFTYYLYDNLILLELTIDKEDNFLSVNVEYSNGNSFDPFYGW